MKNVHKFAAGAALAAAPLTMFAATTVGGILGKIANLIDILIPILIAAGLAYFIFGVVRYVIAGDADKKEEARSIVIRGIIGLFVIVSIWGLIGIIQSSFDIGSGGVLDSTNIPNVKTL